MEKSYVSKFAREMLVLIFALVISFILQLIGFVTPGWMRLDMEIGYIYFHAEIGLWYSSMTYCDESGCVTKSVEEFLNHALEITGPGDAVGGVEVMTTIALISCIVAFVATLLLRRKLGHGKLSKFLFIVSVTGSVVSGAMAMSSAAYMGEATRNADSKLRQGSMKRHYKESMFIFPYSVFLTGLGGLIGPFTLGLLLSIWCKLNEIIRNHLKKGGVAMTTLSGNS